MYCETCQHAHTIEALKQRDDDLMESIRRIEAKVDKVVEGVQTIRVHEEKHANHEEAFSRAFAAIESLREKNEATEKKLDALVNKGEGAAWAIKILWVVGGVLGGLALSEAKYIIFTILKTAGG